MNRQTIAMLIIAMLFDLTARADIFLHDCANEQVHGLSATPQRTTRGHIKADGFEHESLMLAVQ